MTICGAGLFKGRIVFSADCRASFLDGSKVDTLSKFVRLRANVLLMFAGDIKSVREICRNLQNAQRYDHKDVLKNVESVILDIREAAGRSNYLSSCQFIIACCSPESNAVATVSIHRSGFTTETLSDDYRYTVIGAKCSKDQPSLLAGLAQFPIESACCVFGSMIRSHLRLDPDYARTRDLNGVSEHSIDGYSNSDSFVFSPASIEMFRGRIADRNEPRGYAQIVRWESDDNGNLWVIDSQKGTRHRLRTVFDLNDSDDWFLSKDIDPYHLQ